MACGIVNRKRLGTRSARWCANFGSAHQHIDYHRIARLVGLGINSGGPQALHRSHSRTHLRRCCLSRPASEPALAQPSLQTATIASILGMRNRDFTGGLNGASWREPKDLFYRSYPRRLIDAMTFQTLHIISDPTAYIRVAAMICSTVTQTINSPSEDSTLHTSNQSIQVQAPT